MRKQELFLILHNIRSAYNVGSIFRTADAAGVSKIFLGGYTPNPAQEPKIVKTALGAEKVVLWENKKQTWRLLAKLQKEKVQIVALEQSPRAIDYRKFSAQGGSASGGKPKFPMALVLGNEVGGLSKEILKYCDKVIAIPMYGQKESLNVSVAAGIALFEIIKKTSE